MKSISILNLTTSFAEYWEQFEAKLRADAEGSAGFSEDTIQLFLSDLHPKLEKIAAGESIESVLVDFEVEYLAARYGIDPNEHPPSSKKLRPDWLKGVFMGSKKD